MAFNFERKIKEIQRLKKTLPRRVGNVAKNHYLKAFRDQGFTDDTLDPWTARKTKNRSDRRNKRRRAILVDKGHLRRSIRVGRATWNRIEVGSYGVKYARFHNRGEGKLPRRQFVGASRVMNAQIRRLIQGEIKRALK